VYRHHLHAQPGFCRQALRDLVHGNAGHGRGFGSCTGFSGSNIYTGTPAGFAGVGTNYNSGMGTLAPSSNPTTAVYRITRTLKDDNNARGLTAVYGFTWEAQNS
jgi:hypothetical protein